MNEIVEAFVARLDANRREAWEERAAIMQFDGGLPREQAECMALLNMLSPHVVSVSVLLADLGGHASWILATSEATTRERLVSLGYQITEAADLAGALDREFGGIARVERFPFPTGADHS